MPRQHTVDLDKDLSVRIKLDTYAEKDPIWLADKPNYYTKSEIDLEIGGVQEDLDLHILDTAAHGANGEVVGTNNTQILNNKTLYSAVLSSSVSGSAIDQDTSLAANSNYLLVPQRAIKTFVENFFSLLTANTGVFTNGTGKLTSAGTLGIGQGGTGQSTRPDALNALLPPQFGKENTVLKTDGVNAFWQSELYWTEITGPTHTLQPNVGHVLDYPTMISLTLPATSKQGEPIEVVGKGSGGWILHQNAGQQILFGDKYTTVGVGGSLSSSHPSDTIRLVCITTNTVWRVVSSMGNINVI